MSTGIIRVGPFEAEGVVEPKPGELTDKGSWGICDDVNGRLVIGEYSLPNMRETAMHELLHYIFIQCGLMHHFERDMDRAEDFIRGLSPASTDALMRSVWRDKLGRDLLPVYRGGDK